MDGCDRRHVLHGLILLSQDNHHGNQKRHSNENRRLYISAQFAPPAQVSGISQDIPQLIQFFLLPFSMPGLPQST